MPRTPAHLGRCGRPWAGDRRGLIGTRSVGRAREAPHASAPVAGLVCWQDTFPAKVPWATHPPAVGALNPASHEEGSPHHAGPGHSPLSAARAERREHHQRQGAFVCLPPAARKWHTPHTEGTGVVVRKPERSGKPAMEGVGGRSGGTAPGKELLRPEKRRPRCPGAVS